MKKIDSRAFEADMVLSLVKAMVNGKSMTTLDRGFSGSPIEVSGFGC